MAPTTPKTAKSLGRVTRSSRKPAESPQLDLERLVGELRAENADLRHKLENKLLDRSAKDKIIAADKATIALLRSQLEDQNQTIAQREDEFANNKETVVQLQKQLDAERNAKTQDAKRLESKIHKIQKEFEEAKIKYADEQAEHDELKRKLSEAKTENIRLSKAMEQIEVEQNEAHYQELADKARFLERKLEEAQELSKQLEVEKNRAEERNGSLIRELRDAATQAEELARKQDQVIQDLRDEIRHKPAVDTRPDSAMSPRALNFTPQSASTTDTPPHNPSRPKPSASANHDELMLDLSGAHLIDGQITTVTEMDLPNSNPAPVDALMTDSNIMESLSGTTKDADHQEYSSTDLQNSGQLILPGDGVPTDSGGSPMILAESETCDEDDSKDSREKPKASQPSLKHSMGDGTRRNPGRKARQGTISEPQSADIGDDTPTIQEPEPGELIIESYMKQSRGHIHLRFIKQSRRREPSSGPAELNVKLSLRYCSCSLDDDECPGLGHIIPLHSLIVQLCHHQAVLTDFRPLIIRLGPQCKSAILSSPAMEELLRLLEEIADNKNIPPVDEDELIRNLLGDIKQAQDHLPTGNDGSVLTVAHMVRKKLQLAKDEKNFLSILYYSILGVYKYTTRNEGEAQFYEMMKDEFGEFGNYEKEMLDLVMLLHSLCNNKDVSQAWDGRLLLLVVYLRRNGSEKLRKYLKATKRPVAYCILCLLLSHPHFMAHHLPSNQSNLLRHRTPLSVVQGALSRYASPSFVGRALGYSDSHECSSATQQPSLDSLFSNSYANAPQPAKPAHPMDMVQYSKLPIKFAPNPNQILGPAHKTPVRLVGAAANGVKPSAKSSQGYQGGSSIDLPEIPTNSPFANEVKNLPDWDNTPARNQRLIIQETADTVSIFGPPTEVNLEELFESTKRTSSAQTTWLKGKNVARVPLSQVEPVSPCPPKGAKSNHNAAAADNCRSLDDSEHCDEDNDLRVSSSPCLEGKCINDTKPGQSGDNSSATRSETHKRKISDSNESYRATKRLQLDVVSVSREYLLECLDQIIFRKPENLVASETPPNLKLDNGMMTPAGSSHTNQQLPYPDNPVGTAHAQFTDEISFSKRLRTDVASLVIDMIEKNQKIQVNNFSCRIKCICPNPFSKPHRSFVPNADCEWRSVLRLLPGRWFNDELVNSVPALKRAPVDCRTFVLPTVTYDDLKVGNFELADSHVKKVPRDRTRWVLPINKGNFHWMTTAIDWKEYFIGLYDPSGEANPNPVYYTSLLEPIKNWVDHLAGVNPSWRLGSLRGPKQGDNDFTDCGVYSSWQDTALVLGVVISEGIVLDPLLFRTYICLLMQDAARAPDTYVSTSVEATHVASMLRIMLDDPFKREEKRNETAAINPSTTPPLSPSSLRTALNELKTISSHFRVKLIPDCVMFVSNPPKDPANREFEHRKLTKAVSSEVMQKLNSVGTEEDPDAREMQIRLVKETQMVLSCLGPLSCLENEDSKRSPNTGRTLNTGRSSNSTGRPQSPSNVTSSEGQPVMGQGDAEEGIETAASVLCALSTEGVRSGQVGNEGQTGAASAHGQTPAQSGIPTGNSSSDARSLIDTSVEDGNPASNPVAVVPSPPENVQTSLSETTAREAGDSAMIDTTPVAAVVIPSASTRPGIHNEALNETSHCTPKSPGAEQVFGADVRASKSEITPEVTIGEKTGISTDAGDVRVVPDADTSGSTQLVHSVKRKNDNHIKYPQKLQRFEGCDDVGASTQRSGAPHTPLPRRSTRRAKKGATPARMQATPKSKQASATVGEPISHDGMGQRKNEQMLPSTDMDGDSGEMNIAANVLAALSSSDGFASMEAESNGGAGPSIEKSVPQTIWSGNFVDAGIKPPTYPSAGETIVEHIPESTGDQMDAMGLETEPASVTVQGDSLPSFNQMMAELEGAEAPTGFNDPSDMFNGWIQETLPQDINEADPALWAEMTFGETSQFNSATWWTDADSMG